MTDELREAERRIAEHPGYREHMEIDVLYRSLNFVFLPNLKELLALLEAAATEEILAVELVQNAQEPIIRDRFHSAMTQRLHNYLASAESLVGHVRHLVCGRSDYIAEQFTRRKEELLQNPEVPFMKDFRNFIVHRALPFFAHRLQLRNLNTPERAMESEVELDISHLLQWDGWSAASRAYLMAQEGGMALRPIVKKHAQLLLGLNGWLHDALSKANTEALAEVNKLVEARNAVLRGCPHG